ncbi:MAG: tetratricopeptide repeat protein, partial [Anaerolineae bacterium]|nr:tetratricopeptide repeat protein [Anaerolineae bacterium]MDW8071223.1 tetratricopeptide repeat protein [Anaerolineae bacterium]
GSANLSFILVWTVLTAMQPIPQIAPQALEAYVSGRIMVMYAMQEESRLRYEAVLENADQAIVELNRAIALRPDYTAAYITRGDAYALKGEALLFGGGDAAMRDASLRQAVADYRRALELQPDNYHAHWNLSWALYLLGEYEPAFAAIQRVIELSPMKQFGARLVLGEILMAMGKLQEGLAEIHKAIEHAAAYPLSSDAYYFRQAIRNAERLQVVRPHPGLSETMLLLKESFVSLQYRGKPYPGTTRARITRLTFGVPTVEHTGEVTSYQVGDRFPADTKQVNVLFDYQDVSEGEQIVLKVYFNGVELPLHHQVMTWHGDASGHYDQLAVKVPVEHTPFGLLIGRYRVEIYVEGNLRASGEFTVGD